MKELPLKKVSASLTPQALALLDQLVTRGLHGRTRTDAIRRIVDRYLIEHADLLRLRLPKGKS